MIYRFFNVNLPRDSSDQSKKGKKINFETANLGDLAFFEENNKITHVGIILEKNYGVFQKRIFIKLHVLQNNF